MKEQIIKKIKTKNALIGIIGLGYVGLPLSLQFVEAGFRVSAFDIDKAKVDMLNDGKSYIKHIGTHRVSDARNTGRLEVTSDFSLATETDALILCVPTPLGQHQEPDLSYVITTLESILPYLRKGQLVSLESTTYPGTTDELLGAKGAIVSYADPHVPVIPKMRKHRLDLRSVELTPALLSEADCVLIATDHDAFDYDHILKNSRLIVDTRGRYRKAFGNVVRA